MCASVFDQCARYIFYSSIIKPSWPVQLWLGATSHSAKAMSPVSAHTSTLKAKDIWIVFEWAAARAICSSEVPTASVLALAACWYGNDGVGLHSLRSCTGDSRMDWTTRTTHFESNAKLCLKLQTKNLIIQISKISNYFYFGWAKYIYIVDLKQVMRIISITQR